jgi:hypothetical protein
MRIKRRRKQDLPGVIDRCSEYYFLDPLNNIGAGSLGMVFGLRIASTTFTGYSATPRAHTGKWTVPELTKFRSNP